MLLTLIACFELTEDQVQTFSWEDNEVEDQGEPLVYVSGLELTATGEPATPDVPDNPFEGEEYLSVVSGEVELCRISWRARAEWDPITEGGPELQYENSCFQPAIRGDVALCKQVFGDPEPMISWPLGVVPFEDGSAEFLTHDGEWVWMGDGWYGEGELGYEIRF